MLMIVALPEYDEHFPCFVLDVVMSHSPTTPARNDLMTTIRNL